MTYRELINEVLMRLREPTIKYDWSGSIDGDDTLTTIAINTTP